MKASSRRARLVVALALLGAPLIGVVGLSSPALAGKGAPAPNDPRATVVAGNITMCESGSDVTASLTFTYDSTGEFVTITDTGGATVTTIYVKGGPNYNVYHPGQNGLSATPPWTLRSPTNRGGQIPTISHWFACGTPGVATCTSGIAGAVTYCLGYADTFRPVAGTGVPSPWSGDSGVTFEGASDPNLAPAPGSPGWDAGAVLLKNRTGGPITVAGTGLAVGPDDTIGICTYTLDPFSTVVPDGGVLIFTQSGNTPQCNANSAQQAGTGNFDTSESWFDNTGATLATTSCGADGLTPHIHFNIGGALHTITDSTKVTNTGGFDGGFGPCGGVNELTQWTAGPTVVA